MEAERRHFGHDNNSGPAQPDRCRIALEIDLLARQRIPFVQACKREQVCDERFESCCFGEHTLQHGCIFHSFRVDECDFEQGTDGRDRAA